MSMAEFTGQTYGEASRQQASQRAVRPGPPPPPGAGVQAGPLPLTRPSERPNEPVTAGIPMGEGPGPEALDAAAIQPGSREDSLLRLRAIVSRYPSPALLQLLYDFEQTP
jgi:hypothetical protein